MTKQDDLSFLEDDSLPCPTCSERMTYTGLPDLMGPTSHRFYRCPRCGIVRVDAPQDDREGWG